MKKRAMVYFLINLIGFSFLFIAGSILEVNAFNLIIPFYNGLVNLGVVSNAKINISSPLNTTYNFSIGDNYTINLSVSSNFNLISWRYKLNSANYVFFTPNISFNASVNSNELIVFANDSGGNVFNKSVVFFVSVPNSNPIIGNISNKIFVCEGNYLAYDFNVSDSDGDSLTADINPINPFYVSQFYSFSNTLKGYIIYSGILSKDSAGGVNVGSKNYSETITVADDVSSDSKNTNITVIEINNAPSISNIGVQTIWSSGENTGFNYQTIVSDIEDGNQNSGNLNFSISFSGQKLFNISSNGVMNFTANSSYLGVYNISVCVNDTGIDNPHRNISLCGQDGSSITTCNNFSLTVTNENRAPNITNYFPLNLSFNVSGSDLSYFNITAKDSDGTIPDAYWYVDDVLKEYDSGSLADSFFYIFGCGISGSHTIKVRITDGELNDSMQWNLSVISTVCPVGVSPGGGGGGGGGGGKVECTEKWGCEQWPQCKNLKTGINLGEINFEYQFLIKERCNVFNWSNEFCGYQIRKCSDLNFCKSNLIKPGLIRECYYTENPTCDDKIKNCHSEGCEVLVDCGGPCSACSTCSDNIKNQGETDIDCGGPCPFCEMPAIKPFSWFVYMLLLVFITFVSLVIWMIIKYYQAKKVLRKRFQKKKTLSNMGFN